ncbi:MAG TPA: hypothetical protein VFQ30_08385 [Ktedonobacteraceae bacterium]|nr:hypothetical protein [Ktedonobacteraceae bacterium]
MSRRLAHRPRYRNLHHFSRFPLPTQKAFFHTSWAYRRQTFHHEQRTVGQGLLSIPLPRFVHSVILRRA